MSLLVVPIPASIITVKNFVGVEWVFGGSSTLYPLKKWVLSEFDFLQPLYVHFSKRAIEVPQPLHKRK